MGKSSQLWLRISIINLLIVSFAGVILRYKIAFSLPFVDQKHLLHGHSHFAFAGWINQIIMFLIIYTLAIHEKEKLINKFKPLFYINLLTAYGMLISFTISGYTIFSISFSTLSILNSYVFGILVWKEINNSNKSLISHWWIKAGIIFNILSSIGAFVLSFLMASRSINQNYYLLAVYAFLHFQYNGWFFFACMGLFISHVEKIPGIYEKLKIVFWLFCIACVPAYFLSALWLPMPNIGYYIIVIAAIAQCLGGGLLLLLIYKKYGQFVSLFHNKGRWLIYLAGLALSVKLVLQLISTIPFLSQLAFGFRPVVIGYLHLMLLGVITLFILGYIISNYLYKINQFTKIGIIVFIIGIIVNQILLLVQGIAAMNYVVITYVNESLFTVAVVMFIGLLFINVQSDFNHKSEK